MAGPSLPLFGMLHGIQDTGMGLDAVVHAIRRKREAVRSLSVSKFDHGRVSLQFLGEDRHLLPDCLDLLDERMDAGADPAPGGILHSAAEHHDGGTFGSNAPDHQAESLLGRTGADDVAEVVIMAEGTRLLHQLQPGFSQVDLIIRSQVGHTAFEGGIVAHLKHGKAVHGRGIQGVASYVVHRGALAPGVRGSDTAEIGVGMDVAIREVEHPVGQGGVEGEQGGRLRSVNLVEEIEPAMLKGLTEGRPVDLALGIAETSEFVFGMDGAVEVEAQPEAVRDLLGDRGLT